MSKRCRLNSHATRRDAIAMLGLLTAAPLAGTFTVPASAQTSGQPIRVGSSLSLTGPLGAVAACARFRTGYTHR
jgi:hypothetical protein